MNRKLYIISIMLLTAIWTKGQEVIFSSQEMEYGVRLHLGIDETVTIASNQLDTISTINLSGLGVTDISDVAFMPHIRQLYLQDNAIEDITPLLVLDSLRYVNLSHNKLTSVFALSFSHSTQMEVDLSFNYITNFSCFTTLTPCHFTIKGANLQKEKESPYFVIRYLYTDGTGKIPTIHYRLDATTTDEVQMMVQGVTLPVAKDNQPHVFNLNENCKKTQIVVVSDNMHTDSTYLVPLQIIHVEPATKVCIETGLSEDYELRFLSTQQGKIEIDGTNIIFTATDKFNYEEVVYSFYQGGALRGFAKVILTSEGISEGLDEVIQGIDVAENHNSSLNVSYNDNMLNVKWMSESLADESSIGVFDISGKNLITKHVDSRHGIDEQISIGHLPKSIIIVRVISGNKIYSEKVVLP